MRRRTAGTRVSEGLEGAKLEARNRGEVGNSTSSLDLFARFMVLIFFCRTAVIARVAGIEPTHTVLKTGVLPLNYTPLYSIRC